MFTRSLDSCQGKNALLNPAEPVGLSSSGSRENNHRFTIPQITTDLRDNKTPDESVCAKFAFKGIGYIAIFEHMEAPRARTPTRTTTATTTTRTKCFIKREPRRDLAVRAPFFEFLSSLISTNDLRAGLIQQFDGRPVQLELCGFHHILQLVQVCGADNRRGNAGTRQ